MTTTTHPPCNADVVELPAKGTRVRWIRTRVVDHQGTVHDTDPTYSRLLVLRDGAMFSAWYHASDWEPVGPDEDDAGWDEDEGDAPGGDLDYEDDGFAEHDADDAIKDALYEDGAS